MDAFASFILAAIALAGSPGPATLSLTAVGAAYGTRRSLTYLAGIVAGMVVVMAAVASGLVSLLLAVPGAAPFVAAAAAVYFLHLAWRIATAPPLRSDAVGRPPGFLAGALLSLANPKGYAAMAALYSGFVLVRGQVAIDVAAKTLLLTAIIMSVNIAWLLAGSALASAFCDPRRSRAINVAFALLLVLSVAIAFLPL
ncbi:MAG: LysE family translocator [Pseudomonadota bacterium]